MKTSTKLLIGGGAVIGLYWWRLKRCAADDLDATARQAAKTIAGLPSVTAVHVLRESLPREAPHLWQSCRPALLAAMSRAGIPAHVMLALQIAAATEGVA